MTGAEQRKARLTNVVLANGWDNRVVVVERRVHLYFVTQLDVTTQNMLNT